MELYVYSNETQKYVDIIVAKTNEDCEREFEDKWGSNDYSATYSPGLHIPEIGDDVIKNS